MRGILDNKTGQLDYPVIAWLILVFGLLLLAPIILKVFNSVKTPFSQSLGNITNGGIVAQTNFNHVIDTAVNFWDKVILAAFILSTLILFISAFLIDSHPFWIILYVFISFMLILFAPDIIGSLDNLYNNANFALETSQLSFIGAIRNNFGIILTSIMMITGIIIYGKIALGGKTRT